MLAYVGTSRQPPTTPDPSHSSSIKPPVWVRLQGPHVDAANFSLDPGLAALCGTAPAPLLCCRIAAVLPSSDSRPVTPSRCTRA